MWPEDTTNTYHQGLGEQITPLLSNQKHHISGVFSVSHPSIHPYLSLYSIIIAD